MPVFEAFFTRNRFQMQNLGLRKVERQINFSKTGL